MAGPHACSRGFSSPCRRVVSAEFRVPSAPGLGVRALPASATSIPPRVAAMECAPGFSEAAEIALAHEESNSTKKAYARSELDEQRAKLMQQWADYVLPDGLGDG